VVLYNPKAEAGSTIQVQATTVKLFSDAAGTTQVASTASGPLAATGTAVNFAEVQARVVRVEINSVTGSYFGKALAGLAEIEVIARGEAP
jgi:hypothetical protein